MVTITERGKLQFQGADILRVNRITVGKQEVNVVKLHQYVDAVMGEEDLMNIAKTVIAWRPPGPKKDE